MANNVKVKTHKGHQQIQKVPSQWMHTLQSLMDMHTTGPLPMNPSAEDLRQRMFSIPPEVRSIYASFKDSGGREMMVVPFMKDVSRINQISMKLGCAGVALTSDMVDASNIANGKPGHYKDTPTAMEASRYILNRCRSWFAALEEQ